jgi:hypothetical protein
MKFYVEQNRKFKHVFQILCFFMYWGGEGGAGGEGLGRVGSPLYVHVGCGYDPGFFIESHSFSKKEGKKTKK